ncbi:hypothetical protein ASPFODRAFT_269696 [Aspergillus luchuensis CBS 106.47]|uniref:Uncharacterized protein n=1 Tax=Aspergillus luchuensis (strain CBS 106.47) TaxID=1137211 RepID=A0A1M3U0T4_ASPLC|nr:hypothetical protein ASPFODRAFT_269696 [Aspergillus luchuensis CBS 106.47]
MNLDLFLSPSYKLPTTVVSWYDVYLCRTFVVMIADYFLQLLAFFFKCIPHNAYVIPYVHKTDSINYYSKLN